MVLLPKIDFLISKQNSTPKLDPKMLKQYSGIATLRHVHFFYKNKQSSIIKINKQMNKYLYYNELFIFCLVSVLIPTSDSKDMLNHFSCLVSVSVYKFKIRGKLHLNSH